MNEDLVTAAETSAANRAADPVDGDVREAKTATANDSVEVRLVVETPPAAETSRTTPNVQAAPVDTDAIAERVLANERARIAGIYDAARKLGLEQKVADTLARDGVALDAARGMLIDRAAERDRAVDTRPHIRIGGLDERQVRRGAVETALLHRFDPHRYAISEAARDWRGYSLIEMARSFLEAEGVRMRGLSLDEIATRALHTTSDFPATRIPALFGTAAATLESDVVWGIVTSNPNMADGVALFHATHKNLVGTGTALDVANLGKARAQMAKQTALDGKTVLNIRPAFLVVPSSLELTAEQLIAQNLVPAKSTDVVPASSWSTGSSSISVASITPRR